MYKLGLLTYPETMLDLPLRDTDAILATLYEVGLPEESYLILGGANMVLRGIKRYTTDLDLLVSPDSFEKLASRPGAVLKDPPIPAQRRGATNKSVWVRDLSTPIPISAVTSLGDGYYPMTFDEYRGRAEIVNFTPCMPLGNVIASKLALQRPKDVADLDAIAAFTGQPIELQPPTVPYPHFES